MLAARSTASTASRLARSFATVVDAAGVKVAAADFGQPTSAVTILVKAGSRYEPKPGVANVLKNFAFKATTSRSALGTVRESELYGGVLSSSLTREHLAVTAEFLRGDEEYFVDVLSSFINSSKFTPWELSEGVLPLVAEETRFASGDATTRAVELAHALAFRNGLGSSLFAPTHPSVTIDDVKAYAAQTFGKGNIAIIGTGISQDKLAKLVEKHFASSADVASPSSSATKYHGGETRQGLHSDLQTAFIGFGTSGVPSPELAVLASYLSPKASVKWTQGTSPLSSAIPAGTSAQTVFLPYSDAALFGILVQGPSVDGVAEGVRASVKALKDASTSINPEGLQKAISKAKFSAASIAENRDGLITSIAPKLLSSSDVSLEAVQKSLDGVSASAFTKSVESLLKSKPTFVVVGDTNALPYADEIGL